MPEIDVMDKKAVNRPVPELTRDTEAVAVATEQGASKRVNHRVSVALGNAYMETPCSNCGSEKVIRAGSCGCCTECGTAQGCS